MEEDKIKKVLILKGRIDFDKKFITIATDLNEEQQDILLDVPLRKLMHSVHEIMFKDYISRKNLIDILKHEVI